MAKPSLRAPHVIPAKCHSRESGNLDPRFHGDDEIVIARMGEGDPSLRSGRAPQSQRGIASPHGFAWGLKAHFARNDDGARNDEIVTPIYPVFS